MESIACLNMNATNWIAIGLHVHKRIVMFMLFVIQITYAAAVNETRRKLQYDHGSDVVSRPSS